MSKARWQHLDRAKAPRPAASRDVEQAAAPAGAASGQAPAASPGPIEPGLCAELTAAWGYYHLRQFQACADAVVGALEAEPHLPGAQRLLGMALGRLGEIGAALPSLERAVREEPEDLSLRASLLSAQVHARTLPDEIPPESSGPVGELAAAALWLQGQQLLAGRRYMEAARSFGEAAERFARATPAELLGERLAACYTCQNIAYLLAGQLETAQQGFSRLAARRSLPAAALAFARQLYEVAEALRELEPEERAGATEPLAEVVLAMRLRVRFYDHVRPVAMHWETQSPFEE